MSKHSRLRPGALIAIAVGVAIALLASFNAFGQDRLSVERLGTADGAPVLFIPGLATPGEVFEPYANSRPDLDARLLTLAGFGGAPALNPAEGVISPAAEAIADYVRMQDLSGVVLVGHSLGGQVALHAAGLAPDRIAHVVVVDSLPFFPALLDPNADPAVARARGEGMRLAMEAMTPERFVTTSQQGAAIQAASADHQALVVSYVAMSDQATVAQGMFEALFLDWRGGLGRVEAPVTLLVPHNGFIAMEAEALAARYGAQYAVLDALDVQIITDSRHFIMLDQPERFADQLNAVIGDPS